MKAINIIIIIQFFTMLTFNMAHPVTPKLINALSLPAYMFGIFFAMMSIANFTMAPIWGRFSDIKGRKPFIIIGIIGYGLSQIGFGLSTSAMIILIFRFMGGAFAICYVTTALSYMADVTTHEERLRYIAYYTASGSIGASVGSLLGGYVGRTHYQYTFLTQALFALILSGCIVIALKEDKVINGIVLSLAGILSLIVNLLLNPYLGKRFGEYKTIQYSALIGGWALILFSFVANLWLEVVLVAVFIGTSTLILPMQQSLLTKLTEDKQGEVLGIQGSARAIGMVIGSLTKRMVFFHVALNNDIIYTIN